MNTTSAKKQTDRRRPKRGTKPSAPPVPLPRWKTLLVVGVVAVLALLLTILRGTSQLGGSATTVQRATPTLQLQGGADMRLHPAPAFTLTDQQGQVVTAQSLRGRVIILTFLDATCTQQCPLMVAYLNQTVQGLSAQEAGDVVWVAISVNPNNTAAQATAFLQKYHAQMTMRFLLGTQAQLAPLWKAYYIGAQPGQTNVVHSTGVYLIDQQGRERMWFDPGFDPKALSADTRILLNAQQ